MYIRSYKDLIVWQKAILLIKEIYIVTNTFPKSELYSLTSQIKRASLSIPANIAEGYGRNSVREYIQFYSIALGSALELETHLIIGKELTFLSKVEYERINSELEEIIKMLRAMITKLKNKH
jgi:four helix bundle protein